MNRYHPPQCLRCFLDRRTRIYKTIGGLRTHLEEWHNIDTRNLSDQQLLLSEIKRCEKELHLTSTDT